MIRLQSGTSRLKLLLGALVSCAALAVGSAYGSVGSDVDLLGAFDAVFHTSASAGAEKGLSSVSAEWQPSFERFEQSDRAHAPVKGGVVFVGSSSISSWDDLHVQFPTHNIVQRGLAGASMADCAHFADRLILPYRPRIVVVYAGDNDLAAGVAPEQIAAAYADLVRQVHRVLPATKIVFVSIKPSPSREALMPLARVTNALVAARSGNDRRLDFVNIFTVMLDSADHVRRELFRTDGLHMNVTGYALWRDAIADHLD